MEGFRSSRCFFSRIKGLSARIIVVNLVIVRFYKIVEINKFWDFKRNFSRGLSIFKTH